MAHYECIREIFNKCSGNQMRDVFVSELETDDLDQYMERFLKGGETHLEKLETDSGIVVYELELDGLKQRFAFTPCEPGT